jgi:hypothetical protein
MIVRGEEIIKDDNGLPYQDHAMTINDCEMIIR